MTPMKKILVASAVTMLCGTGVALAGTATGTVTVNITVTPNCTVNSPTLAMTYLPGAGAQPATPASATMSVGCSPGTNPTSLVFNGGANTTGWTTAAARQAANTGTGGGNNIQYNLYSDAAATTVLGTLTAPTGANAPSFSKLWQPVIYAQVLDNANNQAVLGTSFRDTVTATLSF
jgi:spore coat protein U-like protein